MTTALLPPPRYFMIFIRESLFIFSLGKTVYVFHVCKIFYTFIMESMIIVFARERLLYILLMCVRLFMLFRFTCTVYKSYIN
jgi:hypothetical protein